MSRKKSAALLFLVVLFTLAALQVQASSKKELTLLVYLSGTDLEAEYGAATADLNEMLQADLDEKNVNVVILAGGSKTWHTPGLKEDKKNTLKINDDEIRILKNDQLTSMGDEKTLSGFVSYGISQFPARQYGLIFWDHGGGAVDGVCLDAWYEDCLTMDEIDRALKNSLEGRKLSFVGFDACLMSTLEVAKTLAPYADYMVASEELEPGNGWDYTFLSEIKSGQNMDALSIVSRISDYYYASYPEAEDKTIAVLDLSRMDEASATLNTYFTALKRELSKDSAVENFVKLRAGLFEFGFINSFYTSSNMVDLKELIQKSGEYFSLDTAPALEAVNSLIVKNASNIKEAGGLSIFYPYRAKSQIPSLLYKYEELSFYPEYSDFLNSFHSSVNEKVALSTESRLSYCTGDTMEIRVNTALMGQIEKMYQIRWFKTDLDGGRYLRLGSMEGITFDAEGTLTPDFDGKWFTWQDRLLPIEAYGNRYGFYTFPALINGESMRIVIKRDENGLPAEISGAMPENNMGLPAKAFMPIETGDMIQLIYETNVFEEKDGAFQEDTYDSSDNAPLYYGTAFQVETMAVLYRDMKPGTYLYGYGFLDYAQNVYLSDFIRVRLE